MKIYQKLLEIQNHVDGFVKNKKAFNYSYVDGNTVLNEIRPLMNASKLILKQEVISITNERYDYTTAKGAAKSEVLSTLEMRFTWVDCESGEIDENLFAANGMNDFDKGVGSALTYGERYFLLKFFHIPTDQDDIDGKQRDVAAVKPKAKVEKPQLNENMVAFKTAKEKLHTGVITMDDVEARYFVPAQIRELLLNNKTVSNVTN